MNFNCTVNKLIRFGLCFCFRVHRIFISKVKVVTNRVAVLVEQQQQQKKYYKLIKGTDIGSINAF